MMVPISDLWLPIFVSAAFMFIVSSLIHMVFQYHAGDFKKLPGEDQALDALGKLNIPPGDYVMPYAGSMKAMADPVYLAKYKIGPAGFFTVFPGGAPGMGKELTLWFLYGVLISIFSAYVAGRALGPGAGYLAVHRFAGVVAFAGYGLGLLQNSIWYKRSWSSTGKSMFDALIYASVTGGTFGWLWPAA